MRVNVFDPAGLTADRARSVANTGTTVEWIETIDELRDFDPGDPLFALGESAVIQLVAESVDRPIIPVDVDAGLPAIPLDGFEPTLETISTEAIDTTSVPTMSASIGSNTYRSLMDVMAVTAEPARISEFRTQRPQTDAVIDQVRADGINISGPAGTPGYGTAAGGPILDPGVDGVAVVPVGQFRTDHPHWVLDPPIQIEVVREEVPVSLVVDDRIVDSVPAGEPLELDWGRPLEIGVLERSRSHFGASNQPD